MCKLLLRFNSNQVLIFRGSRVRELWRHVYATVAEGRERPLPVQRLRPLLQDERPKQAPHQAQAEIGELKISYSDLL